MTVILNFCSGSTAFWVGLSNQRLAPVRTKSSLKVSETLRAGSFWSTESMASLERLSNTLYTSLVTVNPLAEFMTLCKFQGRIQGGFVGFGRTPPQRQRCSETNLMVFVLEILTTSWHARKSHLALKNARKCFGGRGSAPDPALGDITTLSQIP